jgi:hypothetical protein
LGELVSVPVSLAASGSAAGSLSFVLGVLDSDSTGARF